MGKLTFLTCVFGIRHPQIKYKTNTRTIDYKTNRWNRSCKNVRADGLVISKRTQYTPRNII